MLQARAGNQALDAVQAWRAARVAWPALPAVQLLIALNRVPEAVAPLKTLDRPRRRRQRC
jgi:hypothetical protein